jgi:hypothetical protein
MWSSGGGGAGQVIKKRLQVTPDQSYAVTIPAGGAIAQVDGAEGANGGDTSFGSLLTAVGGCGNTSDDTKFSQSGSNFYSSAGNQYYSAGGGGGNASAAFGTRTSSANYIKELGTKFASGGLGFQGGQGGAYDDVQPYGGLSLHGLGAGGSGASAFSGSGGFSTEQIGGNSANSYGNKASTPGAINTGSGGGGGAWYKDQATKFWSQNGGSGYVEITYWSAA